MQAPSPATGSHFSADAWYFTKEELRQTPSARDGYTAAVETKERRAVCAFMQETGKKLGLPQLSIATGIVFFHRFFALHSLKDYDGYNIGSSCIFLAAKVEETPKKLRDVLIASDAVRNEGSGKEPLSPNAPDYGWLKDQVLQGERAVLQTMAFELTIDHPYKYVLNYVKTFRGNQTDKQTKEIAQVTWNFVNDSLRTTLCLEYRPQVIAAAALLLASRKYAKEHNQPLHLPDMPNAKGEMRPWFESLGLGVTLAELDDCSAQIRDLYDGSALGSQLGKTIDSTPQASGSAHSTPTPISPSPGSIISPRPAAAGISTTPATAMTTTPQIDLGRTSESSNGGSVSTKPAGITTAKEQPQGDAGAGQAAPVADLPSQSGANAEKTANQDKESVDREKEKDKKDPSREKRTHLKQEERNDRKFRPY